MAVQEASKLECQHCVALRATDESEKQPVPAEWKGTRAMLECGARREHPDLKQLVIEASRALAQLDASRLEELALSCQALNQTLGASGAESRSGLAIQARKARGDMAVFARILEATRCNLGVINRLRELRAGRLEYGERPAHGWAPAEIRHGDN